MTNFKNVIPCNKCYKSFDYTCCRGITLLIVHENEAEDYGRHFLEPIDGFKDFYKVKWSSFDESCPHFVLGKCSIHEKRPLNCKIYPALVGTENVYFDLCPGIFELTLGIRNRAEKYLTHMEKALTLTAEKKGFREIIDAFIKPIPNYFGCIMSIYQIEQFITEGKVKFVLDLCSEVDPALNDGLASIDIYRSVDNTLFRLDFNYTLFSRNTSINYLSKEEKDLMLKNVDFN